MADISLQLGQYLTERKWLLAVAESCTAGGLSREIVSVSGASGWFDCGFVTYSNEAKASMLDVPESMLKEHGAVSAEVAKAMAQGTLAHSRANIALSTTGVAGPAGGTPNKPVGTVFIGLALRSGQVYARLLHCSGNREAIQNETIETLLAWACEHIQIS